MTELLGRLGQAINEIWNAEPTDVARTVRDVVGAYHHRGPVVLYGESETRELVDYLWYLRSLARERQVSVDALRIILGAILLGKADKWARWYKWEEVPRILREVAGNLAQVSDLDVMAQVIDLLRTYIGRFNFWLDAQIPWLAIASAYDFELERR